MENFIELCKIGIVKVEILGGHAWLCCHVYKKGHRRIKGEIDIDNFEKSLDALCGVLLEKVRHLTKHAPDAAPRGARKT